MLSKCPVCHRRAVSITGKIAVSKGLAFNCQHCRAPLMFPGWVGVLSVFYSILASIFVFGFMRPGVGRDLLFLSLLAALFAFVVICTPLNKVEGKDH